MTTTQQETEERFQVNQRSRDKVELGLRTTLALDWENTGAEWQRTFNIREGWKR